MLKSRPPRKAHHGVQRILGASQTRWPASASYHSSSTNNSRDPQRTQTDALNEALDSALADYDENDPFREFKRQESRSRLNTDLVAEETHFERNDSEKRPLPLPPFLRNKKLQERVTTGSRKLREAEEVRFGRHDVPKLGKIIRDKYQAIGVSKKKAPFTTRFAENPWARMLGTPVRQCGRTHQRLPTSCLIDFHIVEAADAERGQGEGTGKESETSEKMNMEVMPITMALDLIPTNSKYRNLSDQGKILGKLVKQTTHRRKPEGMASYIALHYPILENISQKSGKARPNSREGYVSRVLAGKVRDALLKKHGRSAQLHWRLDMPEFVLKGLRALVIKRLRYWILKKEESLNPGLIMQIPGGGMLDSPSTHGGLHGWQGVEMIDDVICVLRLRPGTDYESRDPNYDHIDASTNFEAKDKVNKTLFEGTAKRIPSPPSELDDSTPTLQADPVPYKQTDSPTYIKPDSAFQNTFHTPEFLLDLGPLAPERRPSTVYFPTLPYRGRRVPLYDLYYLLGPDIAEDLLKDSAFSGSLYAVLKSSTGTFNVVASLTKLMGYLATSKREYLEKVEQQMQDYAQRGKGAPGSASQELS